MLAFSGWALVAARDLDSSAAAGNRALTDKAGTAAATGDISNTLNTVFSYGPKSLDATQQAARQLLTGTAARQYQQLFAQVRSRDSAQQLTLSTQTVRAGVVTLHGGTARLLVFLDQTSSRADGKKATAAAQLSVDARLSHGQWIITALTAR
ncbi:hypothetical protein BIV57_18395 [Mangrovactinospora gilvigrisea]|uniref:Mce-associated membrane protein n=1 Tax=Mangrovactinospora gilvigrisea TaxID=1428644 RepID=A0A1J7BBL3_9ACTN|nr:hypothetical protein BIV57_18395 [Mangrovactinospora gilvigrisea]